MSGRARAVKGTPSEHVEGAWQIYSGVKLADLCRK